MVSEKDKLSFLPLVEDVEIEIAHTSDDAEDCNYVVCALATESLMFDDNQTTACVECGRLVQFRPYAPTSPPRICIECVAPLMKEEAAKGELGVMITPKTAKEVQDYFAKKKMH